MQIDPFSVVLTGMLIRTILAVLFLVFWMSDRRTAWFGWWSATFVLGNASALCFLSDSFDITYVSFGFGTAFLIAAFSCAWQGARAFEGRRPLWLPLVGLPALWLAICLLPVLAESPLYRLFLSSVFFVWVIGATAWEFWRGREVALSSRWPIIVLFATLALLFAVRVPLAGVAPFPFGAQPADMNWIGGYSLLLILHTVALAVLIVAIARERLEREQRMYAQTDLLTGVMNRRAFMNYAERQIARHRADRKTMSLLVFDIDRFKLLNDRFGHSFGDQVLTRCAAVMRDAIRPGDLLFRLGGDEFCCLLPDTSALQAQLVAERVRGKLEAESMSAGRTAVKLTVSMGIASTETCGYGLAVLMHEADMAVYAAKREGRNKVVIASALREVPSDQKPAGLPPHAMRQWSTPTLDAQPSNPSNNVPTS